MITSFYDGRVRLRSEALKNQKIAETITHMLKEHAGIQEVITNTRTGSLLLTYDPTSISRKQLQLAAENFKIQFEKSLPKKPSSYSLKNTYLQLYTRKNESTLLLGCCALCLVGTFGNKPLHLLGGIAATLLTCKHVYSRRHTL